MPFSRDAKLAPQAGFEPATLRLTVVVDDLARPGTEQLVSIESGFDSRCSHDTVLYQMSLNSADRGHKKGLVCLLDSPTYLDSEITATATPPVFHWGRIRIRTSGFCSENGSSGWTRTRSDERSELMRE